MNALLEKERFHWQPAQDCGVTGHAMQECLPYAEMLFRVAARMTGDEEAAKRLFRATIRTYLSYDCRSIPVQTVKFRLLTLVRRLYAQGAHRITVPNS